MTAISFVLSMKLHSSAHVAEKVLAEWMSQCLVRTVTRGD